MGLSPHVLYSDLEDDLSRVMSKESLARMKAGETDWPGISYRERAATSLWSSLLKKIETGMTTETQQRALEKFLKVNEDCGNWRLKLDGCFGDDLLFGCFKRHLWRFWHNQRSYPLVDHYFDLLERGSLGPGASIGSPGGDFYTKLFDSRMSTTDNSLYYWYRRYIRGFAEWNNAEEIRRLQRGSPYVVEGNRLSFVPKNDDISRSICTEPTLNMFYQLGFGAILTSRLHKLWGVNLTIQQFKNRELARKGSWDGSFATIDLSSASDSISLSMLEQCLPRDFLSWLVKLRCPQSELPNGESVKLNMVSTMGNGYTFPLQTILFTAVVLSAMEMDGLAPVFPHGLAEGNFGVNGDDIVIPTRIYGKVTRLLKILGFNLNTDKTYAVGPFRESCGGDYFEGRNLRGVYIKSLSEPQDVYPVINQLNLFSARTGILLPNLVQRLLKRVRFLPVPRWENDDAGIKVPFSLAIRHIRVNRNTSAYMYAKWTPKRGPRISIRESTLHTPAGFKSREYNLSGLFLSFLQGAVNGRLDESLEGENSFYGHLPSFGGPRDRRSRGDLPKGGDREGMAKGDSSVVYGVRKELQDPGCLATIGLSPKRVRYCRKYSVCVGWDSEIISQWSQLSLRITSGPKSPEYLDREAIQLFAGWFDRSRWETAAYLNLFS